MKVVIQFRINNAAFDDDWEKEIARVLHQAEQALTEHGCPSGPKRCEVIKTLKDTNGNTVGHVRAEDSEDT